MPKQRPSVQKRQRDMQKRERERKKAEKAAIKRERRLNGPEPTTTVLPDDSASSDNSVLPDNTEEAPRGDGDNVTRDDVTRE